MATTLTEIPTSRYAKLIIARAEHDSRDPKKGLETFIDIRLWVISRTTSEWTPTKKGLHLPLDQFFRLNTELGKIALLLLREKI